MDYLFFHYRRSILQSHKQVNRSDYLKISLKQDLLILDLVVVLLILLVFVFPTCVLRTILGLPFVLFLPGYALLAALYPRKGSISGIGLTALSFGLSLAVVPLIGLALNYSPWGISLNSILCSQSAFIAAMSVVAWRRRQRLAQQERFRVEFNLDFSGVWGPGVANKLLTLALVVAILGTFATVAYVIARPKTGETFTEFYILGADGKAQDYPRDLSVGEKASVIVGISNHEYVLSSYHVKVAADETELAEAGPIALAHDEKWEGEISFMCEEAGSRKVEFFLYRDEGEQPYLEPLRLWVEVSETQP